jgi:hypothetical protein
MTFQAVSYTVDRYRRQLDTVAWPHYAVYMTFFPHLAAGPILRASDFVNQIVNRSDVSSDDIREGLWRIVRGLVKKLILSDVIAKAGVIRPLLVLLESRHESCERNAATAIAMLALKHRANQDSIARMGGIGPLVKLTDLGQGHSADVQAQAVLALAEISRHNKELQTAIVKDGAVVNLVLLLTESNSPQVEAEVGGAFWALSEDHPENKDAIAEAMAIPPLITQLASDGERAQTNAANALSSLAFGHNSNQAQIASLLVRLLEEASGGTQDRAAQALFRFAATLFCLFRFWLRVRVFGSGAGTITCAGGSAA